MKILIDLPEEKIEQIKKYKYPTIVERAIQEGAILPDDWYELRISVLDDGKEAESFRGCETKTFVKGKRDNNIYIKNLNVRRGTLCKGTYSDLCRFADKAIGAVAGSANDDLVIDDLTPREVKREKI